jgi:hypothetical protein
VGDRQITPGEWVIMGAGVVMLIASFLDFAGSNSVWSTGSFPIVTLGAIYGIVMGAQIAIVKFAGASLPQRVAGFTWEQIHLALAVFALLMSLGWLISGLSHKGAGFWLLLVGSIALVVGAVMLQRERHTGAF